jgi:hypothetical protein
MSTNVTVWKANHVCSACAFPKDIRNDTPLTYPNSTFSLLTILSLLTFPILSLLIIAKDKDAFLEALFVTQHQQRALLRLILCP